MFISIDVGGTNVRAAKTESLDITNFKYELVLKSKLTHNFEQDTNKLLSELRGQDIEFIGIGLPGDVRQNILYSSNNLTEWEKVDLQNTFQSNGINAGVKVDNDGVVAALGEAVYGHGITIKDFLYITWGTGIGGATVLIDDNKPKVKKINWDKYFDKWEELCGGKSLLKRYGRDLAMLTDYEWEDIFKNFKDQFIQISDLLNNKNIVIGGGATSKQVNRFTLLSKELNEMGINLKVSQLGDDVGLYGGFALALYRD